MIYLMSLIQKKIFRWTTRTASQIFPSDWDAMAGLKKPTREKTAARNTDNQKNTENEILKARGMANHRIIPLRKPNPADMKAIAIRSTASGVSMSLISLRFCIHRKITKRDRARECMDHTKHSHRIANRFAPGHQLR